MQIFREIMPAFNRGGTRYYIDDKRVSCVDFTTQLQAAYSGDVPDGRYTSGLTRDRTTITRKIWQA